MKKATAGQGTRRARLTERVRTHLRGRVEQARGVVAERRDGMHATAASTRLGTRRRAAVPMILGTGALAGMYSLVGSGVLAVNFVASDNATDVYTDRVVGQYAAGYLNSQATKSSSVPVAQIGFQKADLYGFCSIAHQTIGTTQVALIVTGGEPVNGTVTDTTGTQKITADQLFLATNLISGTGENIAKMTLGQSADTLTMGTGNAFPGTAGAFGLQAETMQIANLDADSYGIDLKGSINLPDLKIRVVLAPTPKTKSACVS